jgi:hypothetical protein
MQSATAQGPQVNGGRQIKLQRFDPRINAQYGPGIEGHQQQEHQGQAQKQQAGIGQQTVAPEQFRPEFS